MLFWGMAFIRMAKGTESNRYFLCQMLFFSFTEKSFLPAAQAELQFAAPSSFSPAEKKKRRRRFAKRWERLRPPFLFSREKKETRRARCKEKRAWRGFAMIRSLLLEKCLIIVGGADWSIVRMRLRISAADAHGG